MPMEYEDNGSWACSRLSVTAIDDDAAGSVGIPVATRRYIASPDPGMNHANVVPSSVKIFYDYSRDVLNGKLFDPTFP